MTTQGNGGLYTNPARNIYNSHPTCTLRGGPTALLVSATAPVIVDYHLHAGIPQLTKQVERD